MIDERTENKNYPLPHPENIASQDVERIATAIEMMDADINACSAAVGEIEEAVHQIASGGKNFEMSSKKLCAKK